MILDGIPQAAVSSERLMPIILNNYRPYSILDVGCRDGIWLKRAMDHGLAWSNLLGLDHLTADEVCSIFQIPVACYRFADFNVPEQIPKLERAYDLVLCLELAEHLQPKSAQRLIAFLCNAGKMVIFSAAIPGQGGQGHVNEQWMSYWIGQFRAQGWRADGSLRSAIWNLQDIQPYYRQNIMVFHPAREFDGSWSKQNEGFCLDAVHPGLWHYKLKALGAGSGTG